MCEQCMAGTNSWGEVLPGFVLMRATRDGNTMARGEWGLVVCNDPSFIFSTPRPCPSGIPWETFNKDESFDAEEQWYKEVDVFKEDLIASTLNYDGEISYQEMFNLRDAYTAAGLCQEHGDSFFANLYHYLGLVIEQNPEPLYRSHDDQGYSLTSIREQADRILGLGPYGFGVTQAEGGVLSAGKFIIGFFEIEDESSGAYADDPESYNGYKVEGIGGLSAKEAATILLKKHGY